MQCQLHFRATAVLRVIHKDAHCACSLMENCSNQTSSSSFSHNSQRISITHTSIFLACTNNYAILI